MTNSNMWGPNPMSPYLIINGLWLLLIVAVQQPEYIWYMQKNEVFPCFESFYRMIIIQFNTKVKTLGTTIWTIWRKPFILN